MKRDKALELLRGGEDGIAEWNKRVEAGGGLRDLSAARLDGAKLSGANLSGADLRRADLRSAKLFSAKLIEAKLSRARLRGADLRGADLRGAELLEANLTFANLRGADLSRADLFSAKLMGAKLIEAKLIEANLSFASLRGADLSRADLSRADLGKADLGKANLGKANLGKANLVEAHLIEVDLRGADLRGADLHEALFRRADLDGANFAHATCSWSVFADVDLSRVKGLEAVEHARPSTVGVDTLYMSRGEIPEVFLRGCGVPDSLIDDVPSLVDAQESTQFYSYFISYSHTDRSFAHRLHDALQGKGIRCWLDGKPLLRVDYIYEQAGRGARLSDKVLLCASKDSLTSWWVDNEIASAIVMEQELMKERGKKILALIPLDLDGYIFSDEWKRGIKTETCGRWAADFREWDKDNTKFETGFDKVVQALRSDEGGREAPPEPLL